MRLHVLKTYTLIKETLNLLGKDKLPTRLPKELVQLLGYTVKDELSIPKSVLATLDVKNKTITVSKSYSYSGQNISILYVFGKYLLEKEDNPTVEYVSVDATEASAASNSPESSIPFAFANCIYIKSDEEIEALSQLDAFPEDFFKDITGVA